MNTASSSSQKLVRVAPPGLPACLLYNVVRTHFGHYYTSTTTRKTDHGVWLATLGPLPVQQVNTFPSSSTYENYTIQIVSDEPLCSFDALHADAVSAAVTTTVWLLFDCNSTAPRPIDGIRYDRRHWGLIKINRTAWLLRPCHFQWPRVTLKNGDTMGPIFPASACTVWPTALQFGILGEC